MELTSDTLELFKSLGLSNNLIYVLIVILGLNILTGVIRFILDRNLKNHEKSIHKKNLINAKSIEVQERIYEKMEELSLYIKGEEQVMLEEIESLGRYISNKRIYLPNRIYVIIEELLDYYRMLVNDSGMKDLRTEKRLFDEYAKEFNK